MIEYYKNLSLENLFYIDENGIVQEEEWRKVLKFEEHYEISNLGRLKGVKRIVIQKNGKPQTIRGKILVQSVNKKGYCRIGLTKNNIRESFSIHRLVAIAFIPNPLNLPEVNHKGKIPNKTDNRVCMLEWITNPDNTRYRYLNTKTSSKYVGVCFDKFRNKWSSEITINKKKIKFGRFETELEAYMARYNYEIENNIHNTYRQEP